MSPIVQLQTCAAHPLKRCQSISTSTLDVPLHSPTHTGKGLPLRNLAAVPPPLSRHRFYSSNTKQAALRWPCSPKPQLPGHPSPLPPVRQIHTHLSVSTPSRPLLQSLPGPSPALGPLPLVLDTSHNASPNPQPWLQGQPTLAMF